MALGVTFFFTKPLNSTDLEFIPVPPILKTKQHYHPFFSIQKCLIEAPQKSWVE